MIPFLLRKASEMTRVAQGQMEKPVMLEGAVPCSVASKFVPENGGFSPPWDLPSGYVKIAIEYGHRNSGFTP